MFIPGILSSFLSFSFSVIPVSPLAPFGLVPAFTGPVPLSGNASTCLFLAVDDLVTLLSLDIGVGRTVPFVALVRVTPLGPAFTMAGRNLGGFVGFAAGRLDGPGVGSFALPFPFRSGSVMSVAGGGTGVGIVASGSEGSMGGGNPGGSCFSGGRGSGIVGGAGGAGSGSGTRPLEVLEVDGNNEYGSVGIGGSTEPDLDLEAR